MKAGLNFNEWLMYIFYLYDDSLAIDSCGTEVDVALHRGHPHS